MVLENNGKNELDGNGTNKDVLSWESGRKMTNTEDDCNKKRYKARTTITIMIAGKKGRGSPRRFCEDKFKH